MCGIAGMIGNGWSRSALEAMVAAQHHRGPDSRGIYVDPQRMAGLGHNRLSILDLSDSGRQPMYDASGNRAIVFNGEIYNYLELREELDGYPFRSRTDTEVILAAYERWGEACLDRFLGMFAFAIWDEREKRLFAARDRFGVKPLHYHRRPDGGLWLASEIQALHAAGVRAETDAAAWATYLVYGVYDHGSQTFWQGIDSLPAGHQMTWHNGRLEVRRWYDLAARIGREYDERPAKVVEEEYTSLLFDSVKLRFRSDVPVGINISGGLDSSVLLGVVDALEGAESRVTAFTYVTGDARYDELPWVEQMLAQTEHRSMVYRLRPCDVPALAASVQGHESAPFGGLPTLAYAGLCAMAREHGEIVLLEGQGMDEQWAGYEYYESLNGNAIASGPVQGSRQQSVRPDCLMPEFRRLARPLDAAKPFPDALRNRQYMDAFYTKIPRALRFNDRVSMRASTELREPFLDHRMFELAFRQPPERKIAGGRRKWMLREIAGKLLPESVVEAPKRPVQTPQREWLAGELRGWSADCIEIALAERGGEWLAPAAIHGVWNEYLEGHSDNSFFVWQWISLGLMLAHEMTGVK